MSDTNITTGQRHALGFERPKRFVVDAVELAYTDVGEGLPLVCLHAVGHGSRDFEALRAGLSPSVRSICVDWPGHGRSGPDAVHVSAARYERLLGGLLDHLNIRGAVLLGNSIGGAAAVRFAVRSPARVRALVLCDSGGLARPSPILRWFCRVMAWAYRRGARGARWFRAFYSFQYRFLLRGRNARSQRDRIVAAGREMAPILEQAWRSFGQREADIRALVPQVRCPVLLAWAKADPFNGYRLVKKSLARFSHSEFHFYPGGHAPFLEAPEAFLSHLEPFLAGLR